jgi:hypothetical protein
VEISILGSFIDQKLAGLQGLLQWHSHRQLADKHSNTDNEAVLQSPTRLQFLQAALILEFLSRHEKAPAEVGSRPAFAMLVNDGHHTRLFPRRKYGSNS